MFNRLHISAFDSDWQMSPSGRLVKRYHPGFSVSETYSDDVATVIRWIDIFGSEHDLIVYDAKYRTSLPFYSDPTVDIDLDQYREPTANLYPSTESPPTLPVDPQKYTDAYLNTLPALRQYNFDSSEAGFELICSIVNTDPNINAHRYACKLGEDHIIRSPHPIYLPTLQALARIWAEMATLDSLDPTVKDYPQYALSNWFAGEPQTSSRAWAATYYGKGNTTYAEQFRYAHAIHSESGATSTITAEKVDTPAAVIPVSEWTYV